MSQNLLILSSFFWILISSFCSYWMFISSLCSKLIIWIPAYFLSLLVPCGFFFTSLSITFISSLMFLPYPICSLSILITSVLNSASDMLAMSVSLSSFFWGIVLFFHLGHISLSPQFGSLPMFVSVYYVELFWPPVLVHLLSWMQWSLRYSPGWVNPFHLLVSLYAGEGRRRDKAAAWLLEVCSTVIPYLVASPTSCMQLAPFQLLRWWFPECVDLCMC